MELKVPIQHIKQQNTFKNINADLKIAVIKKIKIK